MTKKVVTLSARKHALIADLRTSGLNFNQLAKKYRVSRQAIHFFYGVHKAEVGERYIPPREPTVSGHRFQHCKHCKKISRLGRPKWSYLIWSMGMIGREVGLSGNELSYHLSRLRRAERVPYHFGRILSDRVAQAYRIYLSQATPICRIGEMFGFRNFGSIIAGHRDRGIIVPPGLFKYDTETRRKTATATHQEKKRIKGTASRQTR
jgi:hypothetical protein